MHQHNNIKNKYLRHFRGNCGPAGRIPRNCHRARFGAFLLLLFLAAQLLPAHAQTAVPIKDEPPASPQISSKRKITLADAVSIFLQQNLELVAARYDVDSVEAAKLTAKLRPNPEISIGSSGVPIKFNGPFLDQQTFTYGISQDFELGRKRSKRINAADADTAVAEAQFQTVVWQMTNALKRKFYAVLLAESLLDLAKQNQKTFAEIVDHTNEVFKLGEISGLELQRLEIEKFKFDSDLANSERDYELSIRDLRVALGGDYQAMDFDAAGAIEYYQTYDLTPSELRDKAIAARPDLKAAELSEKAADASIVLQEAQKIPNLTLVSAVNEVPAGSSYYSLGATITLPVFDRNQGERAKALIEKQKAQNQQRIIKNQVLGDVDKALVAYEIQKRRLELYKTGVLKKVTEIQTLTEFSLKAGESSTLDLLDAIRTRRDTLAGFYQTIFDYQMSLLDIELATATPLPK